MGEGDGGGLGDVSAPNPNYTGLPTSKTPTNLPVVIAVPPPFKSLVLLLLLTNFRTGFGHVRTGTGGGAGRGRKGVGWLRRGMVMMMGD